MSVRTGKNVQSIVFTFLATVESETVSTHFLTEELGLHLKTLIEC